MASIQPETLYKIADAAAFELGRPWRVKDLRAAAFRACRQATQRAATSGFSSEQMYRQMREHINEQLLEAGRRMNALPPDVPKLTPERIETALEAFTVKQ